MTKDLKMCIHRAGCQKPKVCGEVGHCTSMTEEDLRLSLHGTQSSEATVVPQGDVGARVARAANEGSNPSRAALSSNLKTHEQLAFDALGTKWENTESQARTVARYAAEEIERLRERLQAIADFDHQNESLAFAAVKTMAHEAIRPPVETSGEPVWLLERRHPGGEWTLYYAVYPSRLTAEAAIGNARPPGIEWRVVEYRKISAQETSARPKITGAAALCGNPVMVGTEWYTSCKLLADHTDECSPEKATEKRACEYGCLFHDDGSPMTVDPQCPRHGTDEDPAVYGYHR